MIPRVYIDTSVFGGCLDTEFSTWSKQLIAEFQDGKKIAVISDLTLKELDMAPETVRNIAGGIPVQFREYIFLDEEAGYLAEKYIREKAIARKFMVDAQHIALSTVYRVDVLCSWNFKHIVNLQKIKQYNAINLKFGYPMLEIRSPREIINE